MSDAPTSKGSRPNSFSDQPGSIPLQSPALSTASYKSFDSMYDGSQATSSSQRVYPVKSILGSNRSASNQALHHQEASAGSNNSGRRNSGSPTTSFGSFSDMGRPPHTRMDSATSVNSSYMRTENSGYAQGSSPSSFSTTQRPQPSERNSSGHNTVREDPNRENNSSPNQSQTSHRSQAQSTTPTPSEGTPMPSHPAPEGDLDEPAESDIIERTRKLRQTAQREMADQDSKASTASMKSQEQLMTARFEHASTPDGHMIIVGREGELKSCEEEVSLGAGLV